MPKRTDIDSILIIGAGPIVIGQACEFDYSGAQACKALREEGYRVILVNSNPATIMTDPEMADAIYIEPVQWATVERIIAKERPDALLPTMGGQTALNCALDLAREGVLEKYNVELIAASREAIDMAVQQVDAPQQLAHHAPRGEAGVAHEGEAHAAIGEGAQRLGRAGERLDVLGQRGLLELMRQLCLDASVRDPECVQRPARDLGRPGLLGGPPRFVMPLMGAGELALDLVVRQLHSARPRRAFQRLLAQQAGLIPHPLIAQQGAPAVERDGADLASDCVQHPAAE